ncbi:MAG TPA: hypothetical protein ENH40_01015 [Nitrospirae bacterium]|nr:hypothetical protein BMS3Bbin08_00060 [bacterium BMS3Bbin08]HDZ61710.1 hypothetical protein [Nitrospirota bacterium]
MRKELKADRDKAKQAVEGTKKKINDLGAKLNALREKLHSFEELIIRAEREKKEALENYALNEISKEGFESKKNELERIKGDEIETHEFIEALDLGIKKETNNLTELHNRFSVADRAVWNHIYNEIKKQIQKAAGDAWLRAFSAKLKAGGASYDSLMQDIFGGMPNHEDIHQIQAELAKEYLGDPQP